MAGGVDLQKDGFALRRHDKVEAGDFQSQFPQQRAAAVGDGRVHLAWLMIQRGVAGGAPVHPRLLKRLRIDAAGEDFVANHRHAEFVVLVHSMLVDGWTGC